MFASVYRSWSPRSLGLECGRGRSLILHRGKRCPGEGTDGTPAEKADAVRWVLATRDSLQPFANGVYVNQLGDTSDQLVRAAYRPNYARLAEIKKKYDPNNALRLNQNIKPE